MGPAPLARGEPPSLSGARGCRGTSPARAGRTRTSASRGTHRRDQPRSRGENTTHITRNKTAAGPAPLARGEPRPGTGRGRLERTSPARAGRTASWREPRRRRRDQPRSCGENGLCVVQRERVLGPAPLVRGEPNISHALKPGTGTSPARAGRTSPADDRSALPTDQPRSCGENPQCRVRLGLGLGPAPLARGELRGPSDALRNPGPTPLARGERRARGGAHDRARTSPARAGRTGPCAAARPRSGDQPRSRGENDGRIYAVDGQQGTAPLARGERDDVRGDLDHERTSPARAGRTGGWCRWRCSRGDQPRSRGENKLKTARQYERIGPAPLARGE